MIDHCGLVDLPVHCSECGKEIPFKEYYHRLGNNIYCLDCDYNLTTKKMMVET